MFSTNFAKSRIRATDSEGRFENWEDTMPNVWEMARSGKDLHVAVVSHGLCISELISATLRKDKDAATGGPEKRWTGLLNTAWTRVTVEIPVRDILSVLGC